MIRGTRYRSAIPEARTRSQAEQVEAQVRLDVFHAKYGRPTGEASFARFVQEQYLPWARLNKRSAYDDELIGKMLCAYFAKKTFAEITTITVERFKRDRRAGITKRGNQREPATVNREMSVLAKIFTLALQQGVVATNPCRQVKKLREDNQRTRYLSGEEEAALMAALESRPRLKHIVVLAIHTGMRFGEIMKLRWSEVDFSRNLIHVKGTKTGKDRAIPMSRTVRSEMLELEQRQESKEWVFPNAATGKQQLRVTRSWYSACREAGIEGLRFHDLRHTAATRMADAGADAFTIAAILGHATIQMTARYTHATSEAKRRAVETISQARENCLKFVPNDERQTTRPAVNY
jgi:integrase